MKPHKFSWHRAGIILVTIVAFVVLMLTALGVYMNSDSGRNFLNRQLNENFGNSVSIGAISGRLFSDFSLHDVQIADEKGLWLDVDSIAIRWQPLDLLRRNLRIENIETGHIHIGRFPDSGGSAIQLPATPPVSIDVEAIQVESMILEAAMLGQPAEFKGGGRFAWSIENRIDSEFGLQLADNEDGKLVAEVNLDPEAGHLRVDASLRLPAEVFSGKAEFQHGLDVAITGDGPLSDWKASVRAGIGDLASLNSDIQLKKLHDQYRFLASGTASIGFDLPFSAQQLLAGKNQFDIDASLDENKRLVLTDTKLSNDSLNIELNGTIAEGRVDLGIQTRVNPAGARWLSQHAQQLDLNRMELDIDLNGLVSQPHIQADVYIDSLQIRQDAENILDLADTGGSFSVDLEQPLTSENIPLRIGGQVSFQIADGSQGLFGDMVAESIKAEFTSRLNTRLDYLELSEFQLTSSLGQLSAAGQVEINFEGEKPQVMIESMTLDASIPEVSRFGFWPALKPEGAATIHSDVRSYTLDGGLDLSFEAGLDHPVIPGVPEINAVLGESITLAGNLQFIPDGELQLSDFVAATDLINVTGKVNFDTVSKQLDGSYQIDLPEISKLNLLPDTIRGSVVVLGAVTGPLADPRISGEAQTDDVYHNNMEAGAIRLNFDLEQILTQPKGDLALDWKSSLPARLNGRSRIEFVDFRNIKLSEIDIDFEGVNATGQLELPVTGSPLLGSMTLRSPDLARVAALVGQTVSGEAVIDLTLDEKQGKQSLESVASLKAFSLQAGDARVLDISKTTININATDVFNSPSGTGEIIASGLVLDTFRVDEIKLDVTARNLQQAEVGLVMKTRAPVDISLESRFGVTLQDDAYSLNIGQFDTRFAGQDIRLDKTVSVLQSPESLVFKDVSLLVGDGKIGAEGEFSQASNQLQIDLQSVPLSLFNEIQDFTHLEGALTGTVNLSNLESAPTGHIAANLVDVRTGLTDTGNSPVVGANLDAVWRDQKLKIQAQVSGLSGQTIDLDMNLPLQSSDGLLSLQMPVAEPIEGDIRWKGKLSPVFELLLDDQHQIQGIGDIKLAVGGTLSDPNVHGTANLESGSYENYATGTVIRNITLVIQGDENRLDIKANGSDGGKGKVAVNGTVYTTVSDGFPLDLAIDLEQMLLVEQDAVSASASGKLRLAGRISNLDLSGQLVTDAVEVQLFQGSNLDITNLEVTEMNIPEQLSRPEGKSRQAESFIHLNLDLSIPRKAFLRSVGLETEWSGDLTVTGTVDKPIISGVLNPVRGGYSLLGKQFILGSGSVRFDGSELLDPALYIPFEYRGSDITAIITISGFASDPELKLDSRPSLPEPEIISRVLFGKDAQSLSTGQQIELANAVGAMHRNGPGLIARARDALGVDVLSFDGDSEDSTTVTAGKYVSDRVYLEIERGSNKSDNSATIEYELSPGVRVRTGSKGEGEGKVGVEWRWDY